LLQSGIEVPQEEEALNTVDGDGRRGSVNAEARKYTPFNTFHIGDSEDMPTQLMTADEKIEELECIIGERDRDLAELSKQLENSISTEQLKERVE